MDVSIAIGQQAARRALRILELNTQLSLRQLAQSYPAVDCSGEPDRRRDQLQSRSTGDAFAITVDKRRVKDIRRLLALASQRRSQSRLSSE
jgi:hypothetical protein